MNDQIGIIILVVVAVGALAVAAFMTMRTKRSKHLQLRFGPEYDRMLASAEGGKSEAEARLAEREKRVEKLLIRPVPPELRDRFARSWTAVQARFVDEPGAAVTEADGLVRKVMESRGYPMGTFEERAADISVDHPLVVERYRLAHAIALRRDKGAASTEELRQAFVHYRALFTELLEAPALVEAQHV